MPSNVKWHQNKGYIVLLLFPPQGIPLGWRKQAKKLLLLAFGALVLSTPGCSQQEIADKTDTNPTGVVQTSSPPQKPAEESANPEAKSSPEPQTLSIVRPEHRGKTVYVDEAKGQYMVLMEPVSTSGYLSMAMVTPDSEEATPVATDCVEFQRKDNGAEIRFDDSAGPAATIEDYADWISIAVKTFCNEWEESSVPTQTAATRTNSQITPLPNTEAMLEADSVMSKINVRTSPSTSASAPSYGYPGDFVRLLAETRDEQNMIWYQVKFESSDYVGWVRGDFVTTEVEPY